MLIASADKHHFLFLQSQITHVDVGRHIHSGEMADVYSSVGVRQGCRNGGALEMSFFHISCNFCICFDVKNVIPLQS